MDTAAMLKAVLYQLLHLEAVNVVHGFQATETCWHAKPSIVRACEGCNVWLTRSRWNDVAREWWHGNYDKNAQSQCCALQHSFSSKCCTLKVHARAHTRRFFFYSKVDGKKSLPKSMLLVQNTDACDAKVLKSSGTRQFALGKKLVCL